LAFRASDALVAADDLALQPSQLVGGVAVELALALTALVLDAPQVDAGKVDTKEAHDLGDVDLGEVDAECLQRLALLRRQEALQAAGIDELVDAERVRILDRRAELLALRG